MRILLVTTHDFLPFAVTQVLNPANEYCAIVTDEVEPAKNFVKSVSGSKNIVYPFHDLKECVENFYYDIVLCVGDDELAFSICGTLKKYDVPQNKFVSFCLSDSCNNSFIVKRNLKYFEEHAADFDMFATGISHTAVGLDTTKFSKHKLFNFGRSSEDLYYDHQIAKYVFSASKGGGKDLLHFNWSCVLQFSL